MQLLHLCTTEISLGRSLWGVAAKEGNALLTPRAQHSCTQRVRPASISIPAPSSPNSPAPAPTGMDTTHQSLNTTLPSPGGAEHQNKMAERAD